MDANNAARSQYELAPTIALILLDWQSTEKRRSFMNSQASMRQFGWNATVVFADSKFTDLRASGDDVVQLIHDTPSEWVAIIDDDFVPDKPLLAWLAGQVTGTDVHCLYRRDRANKKSTNLFLWFYSLLTKLLLRIGKNSFKPGMVVFRPDEELVDWVSGANEFCSNRFLARVRLHQRDLLETELSPRQQPAKPIKSRDVIQAIAACVRFWWNTIMFPQQELSDVKPKNSEQEQTQSSGHSRRARWLGWTALTIATVVVLSLNLGFPLFEPDEARNAQIGLNLFRSGEWNVPTLGGSAYWDKPPFLAWATATCFGWFGTHEYSARLPVTLAAIATVLLTFALGQRLVGFRAALIGAFCMLASGAFVVSSRFVTMDSLLTLCSTIVLLAGYLSIFRESFSMRWWLTAALAAGVGFLVKGPIILLLGLPPLIAASWLADQRNIFQPRIWIWFFAVVGMIAGPWFIATAWVHPDFLAYFFWKHHVVRFSAAFNHNQPFWFYLPVLLIGMFPASLFIPNLVRLLATRNERARCTRTKELGFLLITAVWIIGFFSISKSKLPAYILPAYPVICLMLGWLVDTCVFTKSNRLPYWLKVAPEKASLLLIHLICVVQLVILFAFKETQGVFVFTLLIPVSLLLIRSAWLRNRLRPDVAWSGLALIAVVFSIYSVDRLVPAFSESRSIHRSAVAARAQPGYADSKVVFFGREDYGSSFQIPQADVVAFDFKEMDAMCEFLYDHPNSIIVSSNGVMQNLRATLDWSIEFEEVPDSRHLYVSRQGNIRSARVERQRRIREKRSLR